MLKTWATIIRQFIAYRHTWRYIVKFQTDAMPHPGEAYCNTLAEAEAFTIAILHGKEE